MREYVVIFLLVSGATFMVLATLGLYRMPDLLTRMQAATKSGVLGGGLTLLGLAAYFEHADVTAKALAAVVFLALTTPVAAHAIARAAYVSGNRLWEETVVDELRDRYDVTTHELGGDAESPPARDKGEEK